MMLFTLGMWQGKRMALDLARSRVRNWFMVATVKVQSIWKKDMARHVREMWIQEAIFPNFLDVIAINLKKNYYYGAEKFITCKWAYACKTWLGMHTPGKLLVKSRRRPR